MSDGMGREPAYLSSHATNRYFIPNWGKGMENGCVDPADRKKFEPFTSMSEVIDYAKRVEGGMCSLAEWLRDFKDAKCVYIYDKEDRAPWDEVIKNWENFK